MRKLELLAPGGDIDSIKAAVLAGADAIYCGLNKFNARNRATNISFDELLGLIEFAHQNECEVFLTLNILILEHEIPALFELLNRLVNTSMDGVIVQDLGLLYILTNYFPSLKPHASTQLTTHNTGQIELLHKLGATRVNLCRELNLQEIAHLSTFCHSLNMHTEVFVHGSQCISFSGICYMSSVQNGNSGNRGRCSQPCRDRYQTTDMGYTYPLNLKDNMAYSNLEELAKAGVYSLKIEGRIKKYDYIYTVVKTYRDKIDQLEGSSLIKDQPEAVYKVFNRDFSNGYLTGNINHMFIDNPRDQSLQHLFNTLHLTSKAEKEKAALKLYHEKDQLKESIKKSIDQLSIAKQPLSIHLSGADGKALKLNITSPEGTFTVASNTTLTNKGTEALSKSMLLKRLKAFNETHFFIDHIVLEKSVEELFIPFKELTTLKKKALYILNDYKEAKEAVSIPKQETTARATIKPNLSVIISSFDDVHICQQTNAKIYFQLPSNITQQWDELIDFFQQNKEVIPWFPAIIMEDDYSSTAKFIERTQTKLLVTDNLGIAFEAYQKGIDWIAGPGLNTVNSYSLTTLKEQFNCTGAFISNEISKLQIKRINKPQNFELYYSIYHPIVLMTTRQCVFKQVSGCNTHIVNKACISSCSRSSSITKLDNTTFILEKSKGNYHRIYNDTHFLNTAIIKECPNHFNELFIDLGHIKTKTVVDLNKPELIKLFYNLLEGHQQAESKVHDLIHPSTNSQYIKGL